MKSRVSSTVTKPTKRKANPRPRKYASASERQAAYRARAPEVCFRAEPKTVETLDRIADTLDQSRADVLLSMTKFALANHDWARFGLTHKPLPFEYGVNPLKTEILDRAKLPNGTLVRLQKRGKVYDVITNSTGITWRYLEKAVSEERARNAFDLYTMQRKENPMKTTRAKRTPTPAQLAARERFAEMARSGGFKKGAKRKKNPDGTGSYGPFYGDTDAPLTEAQIERKAESYMDRLDRQLMRNEITQTVYNREVKALDKWAKDQYAKRRKTNPADAAPYTVTWKSTASGRMQSSNYRTKTEAVRDAQSLAAEGAKNVEVSKYSPSTGAVAVEWRKTNPAAKAMRRNPSAAQKFANPSMVYQVQHSKDGKAWEVWGTYMYLPMAKDVANRRAAEAPREYVRVESIKVKA